MTDKATLLALAERVEALTGPDASTNADILRAFGWTSGNGGIAVRPDGSLSSWVPDYLGSLDATMTLVPEGCLFHVRSLWDGPETWGYAHVHTYAEDAEDCDGKRHLDDYVGNAATPALALTAAALRAHAAIAGEE